MSNCKQCGNIIPGAITLCKKFCDKCVKIRNNRFSRDSYKKLHKTKIEHYQEQIRNKQKEINFLRNTEHNEKLIEEKLKAIKLLEELINNQL